MKKSSAEARRWFVSGRVQGVGFRWFVQKSAAKIGVRGWTRNEDDGRVQVYGVGTPDQLDRLAGLLHQGTSLSDVRSVEQTQAPIEIVGSFEIR